MSSNSSFTTLLVSVGAVCVLGGVGLITYARMKKQKSVPTMTDASGEVVVDTSALPLTKEEATAVLKELSNQMESIIVNIGKYEQEMVRHLTAQKQTVPEEILREHLVDEFKKAMQLAESQVYSNHKISEDDFQKSHDVYVKQDPEYAKIAKAFVNAYYMFRRYEPEDLPAHLTMDLIMNVMSETMELMTQSMEEIFARLKEENDPSSEAFAQKLHAEYVERVPALRAQVLQKYGLEQVRFFFLIFFANIYIYIYDSKVKDACGVMITILCVISESAYEILQVYEEAICVSDRTIMILLLLF